MNRLYVTIPIMTSMSINMEEENVMNFYNTKGISSSEKETGQRKERDKLMVYLCPRCNY